MRTSSLRLPATSSILSLSNLTSAPSPLPMPKHMPEKQASCSSRRARRAARTSRSYSRQLRRICQLNRRVRGVRVAQQADLVVWIWEQDKRGVVLVEGLVVAIAELRGGIDRRRLRRSLEGYSHNKMNLIVGEHYKRRT